MLIVQLVIGAMLLIFGRKLFWLLVGGVGFLAGSALATVLFQGASQWVILGFALVVGILGIILVHFIQKVGIGLAGFILGGMALSGLVSSPLGSMNMPEWVPFVIGGVMGVLLTIVLFEWSLIIFSSLAGTWMIINAVSLSLTLSVLLFLVLFLIGLTLQFRMKSRED